MAAPFSTLGACSGTSGPRVGAGVGATYPGGGVTSSANVKLQEALIIVKSVNKIRRHNFMLMPSRRLGKIYLKPTLVCHNLGRSQQTSLCEFCDAPRSLIQDHHR